MLPINLFNWEVNQSIIAINCNYFVQHKTLYKLNLILEAIRSFQNILKQFWNIMVQNFKPKEILYGLNHNMLTSLKQFIVNNI